MIYTSFEMIRDCREDRPEGWRYFITNYVPVVQKLVRHYEPQTAEVNQVLRELRSPKSKLFANMDPAPERPWIAALRQEVVEILDRIAPRPEPAAAIDLETLTSALDPLTLLEKQAVWFETMGYSVTETGALLRSAEGTVQKIREKAAERIRSIADQWGSALLAENGRSLGRQAAAATSQCLPSKAFLDVIDGRTTWRGREDLERHVSGCWHCIDHFCRMLEVVELLREVTPLSDAEAQPFRNLLGVAAGKQPAWKRLFGSAARQA